MLEGGGTICDRGWRPLCVAIVGFACLSTFLGWGLGVAVAVRFVPHYPALVPSTAASFILLCTACLIDARGRPIGVANVLRFTTVIFAATNLWMQEAGGHAGVDHLLSLELREGDRMSSATAIGLILASLVSLSHDRWPVASMAGALMGLSTAVATVLLTPQYLSAFIDVFDGMSLPTSCLFAVLFAALLMRSLDATDGS